MAHAWLDPNVSEEVETAFLEVRGPEVWKDHSFRWCERGVEHAAETITWIVEGRGGMAVCDAGGRASLCLPSIPDSYPARLVDAYRLLTGTGPPANMRIEMAAFDEVSYAGRIFVPRQSLGPIAQSG